MAAGKTVLKRVSSLKIGPYGSAIGACTDVGSVRDFEYGMTWSETKGTEADLYDATTDIVISAPGVEFNFTAESFTEFNMAMAMRGVVDGTDINFASPTLASGGTPTYYTLFVGNYYVDDTAYTLCIPKVYIKAGSKPKLSKDQMLLAVSGESIADYTQTAGKELGYLTPTTVDSTPPTITSWSPANGATTVAKASTTLVVLTFSEAVRRDDVLVGNQGKTVGVYRDDTKAFIAGTWAANAACTVFTFTPTSAWPATTTIVTFAQPGIKDVAGNALVGSVVSTHETIASWGTGS